MRTVRNLSTICLTAILCMFISAAGCGPGADSVVGKWQNEANPYMTLEFYSNGEMQATGGPLVKSGKYTYLSEGRMQMEINGLLWGKDTPVWKYAFEDSNRVCFTDETAGGIGTHWKRVQ